jgi:hypothetical protein
LDVICIFADFIFDFTSSEKLANVEKTSKTQIAGKKKSLQVSDLLSSREYLKIVWKKIKK